MPTVYSETCTRRTRYLDVLLYDADRVHEAVSAVDKKDLYEKQLNIFLSPFDRKVIAQAEKDGIGYDWTEAAQNSPIYRLATEYKLAFPLHPEFRTIPVVWYCPPPNLIMSYFEGKNTTQNPDAILPAIEEMRSPIKYLANIFTARDTEPVKGALQRMAVMRNYMGSQITQQPFDTSRLKRLGITGRQTKDMYRLLGLTKHEDWFVIPTSHKEAYLNACHAQGSTGYNYDGEHFGDNCEGCGIAVGSGKTGQEIYNENSYGGIFRD